MKRLPQRAAHYRSDDFKSGSALEARHDRLSGKPRMIAGESLKWLDQLLSELKPQKNHDSTIQHRIRQ